MPRIALGAALFLLYIRVGLYGGRLGLVIAHALLGLPFVLVLLLIPILKTQEARKLMGRK